MTTWPVTTLGALCAEGGGFVRTGPFGSRLHRADYLDDPGGVAVVMPRDMAGGRVDHASVARVSAATAERLAGHALADGDLVLARRGELGRSAWITAGDLPALCGTGSVLVRLGAPRSVLPGWVRYYLRSRDVATYLEERASGATLRSVSAAMVAALPMPVLPLAAQAEAAGALAAMDDLIRVDTERIRVLEEMARAVHREWFAHRRHPDVASPDGWRTGRLADLLTLVTDTADPAAVDPSTPAVGLEHLPRRRLSLDGWGAARDVVSRKTAFAAGDVLFGRIRPNLHKVCVAPVSGICSTDVLVLRPRDGVRCLAAVAASAGEVVAHAAATTNGTKMPRADWTVLRDFPIDLPPAEAVAAFEGFAAPLLDTARCLTASNRQVAAMRDALLPHVVSGTVPARWESVA